MLLKNFVENLEKLANAPIVRDDPAKFYKRLYDVAIRFLSQDSIRLKTRLHALTALTAVYANIRRSHGQSLVSTDADNLRNYFFLEISKTLIGIDFLQLEDDNLTKRLFKKTIVDTKSMLQPLPDSRYFDALENAMQAEWSHSTLLSILRGDDLSKETVHAYIKNFEHEDIMRLRIEALMGSDCEDLSQNLMKHCLACDVFLEDVEILIKRFQFLHKHGNLEEIHQLCSKVSSSTACEILLKSIHSDSSSVSLLLSQTFFLLDWVQPADLTCTKNLLRNWMEFENKIGLQQELRQGFDKILALTSNSKQLIIFIDVTEELFGFKFVELCSSLALRLVKQERHRFVCARLYTKDSEDVESAKHSLAEICFILMRLYRRHPQMNVCCLLSWHYLFPTETGYYMIEQYFSNASNFPFASELLPPPDVSNDVYIRLYQAVELLRHDVLKVSLLWAELKPLLLSNMNRAGFRYVVASNHFVRFQTKNPTVFNVLSCQQRKTKNANVVENRLMQESKTSKKLNGLPSEMNSSKSTRVPKTTIQDQTKEATKVLDFASVSTEGKISTKIGSSVSVTVSNSCKDSLQAATVEPGSSSSSGKDFGDCSKLEMNDSNAIDLHNLADSKSLANESSLGTSDSHSSERQASELIRDSETDEKKDAGDHCLKELHVTGDGVDDDPMEQVTEQQLESNSEQESRDEHKKNEFKSSLRFGSSNQQSRENSGETNARNRPSGSEFNSPSNPSFSSASPPQFDSANHVLLTEPSGDCGKDTMSLAVYDLNGPLKNSSELLLLVTHSESIKSGHLGQINDNNNQVFAVSVKHSVETVWSEDVHDYDRCGAQLISTRLVGSVNSIKSPAMAVECAEETDSVENLDMSVKIPGKEIFVSHQSLNILPVVDAEALLCNAKSIPFGCDVDPSPSAVVVDIECDPVVVIGESISTKTIKEMVVSGTNLEPTSLVSVPESLSLFDVKESDSNVADIGEPSCSLTLHVAAQTSPNVISGETEDTLPLTHATLTEAPLSEAILESGMAIARVQSFLSDFAMSESKPVVDIHGIESTSYSLAAIGPTVIHPSTASSGNLELPCIVCPPLSDFENKTAMEPSISQQQQLTVVSESTEFSVDVQLNVECSGVSNYGALQVQHESDIFRDGEKQKLESNGVGKESISSEEKSLLIDAIHNESIVLDQCQEEVVLLIEDRCTVGDEVLDERDIAPVTKQNVSVAEDDAFTEESVRLLYKVEDKDFPLSDSLILDNLASFSDENPSPVPVVIVDMESDQKCCDAGEESQSLNAAERSPWQELSCPNAPLFARHLDDLAQKSLSFESYSTLTPNTYNLPIAVIRTDHAESFSVYSHEYSCLLPMFPELSSISHLPSSVLDYLPSEQRTQAGCLEQKEILSIHRSVEKPLKPSVSSHDKEKTKSLAKRSHVEYRCHICDKVLNSSKGHRLHAIRVHQVDCVDHLSPANGYTCRKCHKPITLSKITYLRTRVRSKFCTCRSRLKKLEQLKDSKSKVSGEVCNIHVDIHSVHESAANLARSISSSENKLCATSNVCTSALSLDNDIGNELSDESAKVQCTADGPDLCAADDSLFTAADRSIIKSDAICEQLEFSCIDIDAKCNQVLESGHVDDSCIINSAASSALGQCKIDSNTDPCSPILEINSCSMDSILIQHKMISEDNYKADLVFDHLADSIQCLGNLSSDDVQSQTLDSKHLGIDVHMNDQDDDQILKQADHCQVVSDENQWLAEPDHSLNQTLNSESGHHVTGQEGNISRDQSYLDSNGECIATDRDHCVAGSLRVQQHSALLDFDNCLRSSTQNTLLDKMELKPEMTENVSSLSVDFQSDVTASCSSEFPEMLSRNVIKDLKEFETEKNNLHENHCIGIEESSLTSNDIEFLKENAIRDSHCCENDSSDKSQELDIKSECGEMFSKLITNAEVTTDHGATNSSITESTFIREEIEFQRPLEVTASIDDYTSIQDAVHKAETTDASSADGILGDCLSETAYEVEFAVTVISSIRDNLNEQDCQSTVDTENGRCTEQKSDKESIQETSDGCPVDDPPVPDSASTTSCEYTAKAPRSDVIHLSTALCTETMCAKTNTAVNDSASVDPCIAANQCATESLDNDASDAINNLDLGVCPSGFNSDEASSSNVKSTEKLLVSSSNDDFALNDSTSLETTSKTSNEQSLMSTVIKLTVSKKQMPIPHKIPVKLEEFPAGSGTSGFSNSTPLCKLIRSPSHEYSTIRLRDRKVQLLQTQGQSMEGNERLDSSSGLSKHQPAAAEKSPVCITLNRGIIQLPLEKAEVIGKMKQVEMTSCTVDSPLKTFPVMVSHCVEKLFPKLETEQINKQTNVEKIKRNSVKEVISEVISSSASVLPINKTDSLANECQANDECKSEASDKIIIPSHIGRESVSDLGPDAGFSQQFSNSNRQVSSKPEVKPAIKSCNLLKKTTADWTCDKCGDLLPSYSCWRVHVKSCHASSLMPALQTEPSTLESRTKRKSSEDAISSDLLYGKKPKVASKRDQTASKFPSPPQSSDVDDFSSGRVRFEGKTYSRVKDRAGIL